MTIAIELIKKLDETKLNEWLASLKKKWKFDNVPFKWFGEIDIFYIEDKTVIIADATQLGLAGMITFARNYVTKAIVQESLKRNFNIEKHWVKEYNSEELIKLLLDKVKTP